MSFSLNGPSHRDNVLRHLRDHPEDSLEARRARSLEALRQNPRLASRYGLPAIPGVAYPPGLATEQNQMGGLPPVEPSYPRPASAEQNQMGGVAPSWQSSEAPPEEGPTGPARGLEGHDDVLRRMRYATAPRPDLSQPPGLESHDDVLRRMRYATAPRPDLSQPPGLQSRPPAPMRPSVAPAPPGGPEADPSIPFPPDAPPGAPPAEVSTVPKPAMPTAEPGFWTAGNLQRIAAGFGKAKTLGEGFGNVGEELVKGAQEDFVRGRAAKEDDRAERGLANATRTTDATIEHNKGVLDHYNRTDLTSRRGQDIQARTAAASNAVAAGQLDVSRGTLTVHASEARTKAFNSAIELGIPPALAAKQVQSQFGGSLIDTTSMPSAANGGVGGYGTATHGDLMTSADGSRSWITRIPKVGPTYYEDMQTGERVGTLPQGVGRAVDGALRQLNKDDAVNLIDARKAARSADERLSSINTLQSLIPHIAPGNDLLSAIKRNAGSFLGVKIGETDPAAVQLASSEFAQLKSERVKMLAGLGLGQINLAEVKMQQAAGENWAQNPQALRSLLNYHRAQIVAQKELANDWDEAAPEVQAKGFNRFHAAWLKSHKTPSKDTSDITGQPSPGASTSNPAANPKFYQ